MEVLSLGWYEIIGLLTTVALGSGMRVTKVDTSTVGDGGFLIHPKIARLFNLTLYLLLEPFFFLASLLERIFSRVWYF